MLRKCFQRVDDIVSKKDATASEVLAALKALDLVLGLAQGHTPTDKLAEAIMRPDDQPDPEFWANFEKIMEERRKLAAKIN